MNAQAANHTEDKVRQLQRALYRAAKASAERRFHEWNRLLVPGNAERGTMNDLGKPDAGEPHVRFDEGRLETEHGLGTAAPATHRVDSAGPNATAPASYSTSHRKSPLIMHKHR